MVRHNNDIISSMKKGGEHLQPGNLVANTISPRSEYHHSPNTSPNSRSFVSENPAKASQWLLYQINHNINEMIKDHSIAIGCNISSYGTLDRERFSLLTSKPFPESLCHFIGRHSFQRIHSNQSFNYMSWTLGYIFVNILKLPLSYLFK